MKTKYCLLFLGAAFASTPQLIQAQETFPIKKHLLSNATSLQRDSMTAEIRSNTLKTIEDTVIKSREKNIDAVVISGTLKEVKKSDSPVPIEIYSSKFFKANPTPSIFESLQNVNGVRPQLNCNVCNTGDIHINGLEGPYTMVAIDGMPIVSGLSTVYGLTGIPQALIDRVEIVKGPASTLYGSEAVGGLINIITKSVKNAPRFSADIMSSDWLDVNLDIGTQFNIGEKAESLVGINYFNYQNKLDKNGDGFTDITLQDRISLFNKWNFERSENRLFNVAARYVYEERWGGEMNFEKKFRGGDEVYGESIYTNRWETLGVYQLPFNDSVMFQFSLNGHYQDSFYGTTSYDAKQIIGFGQLTWSKIYKKHDVLIGGAYRHTYYDDNTVATSIGSANGFQNEPSVIRLPGIFVQDEITFNPTNKMLLGIRYDYNSIHGTVLTPRVNYKWNSAEKKDILRLSFGTGYRVANVFTEDHAALTGARTVEFLDDLKPEKSLNGNINYERKIYIGSNVINLDATAFYTYFYNRIVPDYLTDQNKIIYANLNGHAVSKGVSLNLDMKFVNGLKVLAGATVMDVSITDNGVTSRQLLTEAFSGVWTISYTIRPWDLSFNYTGNIYGPMDLPLLGLLDDRASRSPVYSLQNIQMTKHFKNGFEIYGGVKNLLNFTPAANSIARPFDPFDKEVTFNGDGQVVATPNNPNALTFDPSYVYSSNQAIRGFLGVRYEFK